MNPLSEHARAILRDIARSPVPRRAINPGVADRFYREGLTECVMMPSPYKTHRRGAKIDFLVITEAGRAVLAAGTENNVGR